MSDIELVIKIPDHLYKLLKELPSDSKESTIENVLMKAVEHGIPLPKGHGKLKDADAICKDIISALGIRDEKYLLEAEKAIYKSVL